ncbi:reticulon-4-interacting protein 1, mitochondrial-like [Brassica napus]|nr:reticulon-4-interacting protein 1, mitochondrial-like [Brassica napus]
MRVMRSYRGNSIAGLVSHPARLSPLRSIFTGCRAVMLPRFGGPEVLELRENVPVPNLNPNEVLVRAKAVSINPLDCRIRAGYGRSVLQPHLPVVIGRDISGEVAAVGNSVKAFKVGQEVFGALHPTALRGTYTDYGILSEEELIEKPSSVSHVEASAIPFAALTAWRALKSNARILEGQRLLVFGGGAVGFAAIQLGVAFGCHVTASCVGQTKERILAAGAEQAVDYLTEDIEVAVKGKFDAVLDTIGRPETERIGINFLRKGGNYMTLQGEAASLTDKYGFVIGLPLATSLLAKKKIQYQYSHGIDYWWTYMRADPEGLAEIQRLVGAGKLKIPVEKTFPITEVVAAHEAKEKKLVPGKVVLEL